MSRLSGSTVASEPEAEANKKHLKWIRFEFVEVVQKSRIICIPEPHVTIFTDCLFVVREGQHGLTQAAALRERLLVHLVLDVANQDLRGMEHTEPDGVSEGKYNTEFILIQLV